MIHWAYEQRFKGMLLAEPPQPSAPEQVKAFNLVTVLYYFGALLGLSLILGTVFGQHYLRSRLNESA